MTASPQECSSMTPNAATAAAMCELENGGGKLYNSLDELFSDTEGAENSDDAPARA